MIIEKQFDYFVLDFNSYFALKKKQKQKQRINI